METEFHSGPTKPGKQTGNPEVLEETTGFLQTCVTFCEGIQTIKHVAIHHNMCAFDEQVRRIRCYFAVKSWKKSKNPRDFTDVWSTFPVRRLASLERMVYLESCGLTEGWLVFFRGGKPWVLPCFTLGTRQEQVVEIIGWLCKWLVQNQKWSIKLGHVWRNDVLKSQVQQVNGPCVFRGLIWTRTMYEATKQIAQSWSCFSLAFLGEDSLTW